MNGRREKHVVFGTGPVGIAIAQALLRRNKEVTMVNRSGRLEGVFLKEAVRFLGCNLLDKAQVLKVSEGATHIYHTANPLYHQWAEVLPSMQAHLIEAVLTNNAVLAVVENLYMYSKGVSVINEGTPTNPPSKKGKIRKDLSLKLEAAGQEKGLDWVSVRGSDYFGPWSTEQSMFGTTRFLDVLNKGKTPGLIGPLHIPHSYTFVGDFGEALVMAALKPEAHRQAWICPNAPAVTTGELAALFAQHMEVPGNIRFGTVPKWVLGILGIFNPVIRELMEMLYQKEVPYLAEGSRFEKEFSFTPTSLEDGVRQTLEWYRNKP